MPEEPRHALSNPDKNKEFSRIYARGKSYVHPNLVLYVAKNRLGYTRIGLTATKKVGHAVQRNRARALCAQHFRNTSRKISADMI